MPGLADVFVVAAEDLDQRSTRGALLDFLGLDDGGGGAGSAASAGAAKRRPLDGGGASLGGWSAGAVAAVDGLVAKFPALARYDRRRETYATLVYGDGPFACGAAVLGSVLRRVDPSRPRTAVVWNASARALRALAGTWDVFDGPPVRKERWSSLRPGVVKVKDGVPSNRKRGLWLLLRFRRVLFFDVDDVPLVPAFVEGAAPSTTTSATSSVAAAARARLDALFAVEGLDAAPRGPVLAAKRDERSPTRRCFNSGMMVLKPDYETYLAYENASLAAGDLYRDKGKAGLCPGHDQPILNHVFSDWLEITEANWSTATPGRTNRGCAPYDDVATAADSYHFFLDSTPWCAETAAGCDPNDLGTCPADAGGTCAGHAGPTVAWWRALDDLPRTARDACRALLPRSAPPPCHLRAAGPN